MDTIYINKDNLKYYKVIEHKQRIYKDGFNEVNNNFYKDTGFVIDGESYIEMPRDIMEKGKKILDEYTEGYEEYNMYHMYSKENDYEKKDGRNYNVLFY